MKLCMQERVNEKTLSRLRDFFCAGGEAVAEEEKKMNQPSFRPVPSPIESIHM